MLSKNQLGFLYMFLSVCAFSLMDLIIKWTADYPLGQVVFFRGFFGIVFYFFVIPKNRINNFYQTKRAFLHFLRCFVGLIAMVAIFIALRNLPLATVVSISFAAPIFTTIFSIFFLSERVGIYRWLAVVIGFVGILIITEPGFESLNIYYIFPIIFCIGLSYVAIAIRQLSSTEPVWLISLNFSIAITIAGLCTLPYGWKIPSFFDFFVLSLVGLFGGVANLWLSQSYKFSEVSLVTPLKYLGLVFAIFFGYLIWGEVPSLKSLIGGLLVILSSIIIFRREIIIKKTPTMFVFNNKMEIVAKPRSTHQLKTFLMSNKFFNTIYFAISKTSMVLKLGLFSLLINILLNYLFVYTLGLNHVGIALATSFSAIFIYIISLFWLDKNNLFNSRGKILSYTFAILGLLIMFFTIN